MEGMIREETWMGEVWVSGHRKQEWRSNIQKLVDGQEVHRRGRVCRALVRHRRPVFSRKKNSKGETLGTNQL